MHRKVAAGLAAAVLTGTVAAAPVASAQAVSAAVAVVYSNVDGTNVSCPLPTTTGVHLVLCDLDAVAVGATVPTNFCEETASVSVLPAHATVGRLGCGVDVNVPMPTKIEVTKVGPDSFLYECSGAGVGRATYSPAPGSAAIGVGGFVAASWVGGQVTILGALLNVGADKTVGTIKAVGFDLCGIDIEPNPFDGTIN